MRRANWPNLQKLDLSSSFDIIVKNRVSNEGFKCLITIKWDNLIILELRKLLIT